MSSVQHHLEDKTVAQLAHEKREDEGKGYRKEGRFTFYTIENRMQEIVDRTEGAIRLGPGSLYWTLNRLQEAGLIEEIDRRSDPDQGDERRRYFRLTGVGREVLSREAAGWAKIVELAIEKEVIRSPRPA